jgi:putative ABC transport system permease protein
MVLSVRPDQTSYVLARCHSPAQARSVVDRLGTHDDVSVFASDEFSLRTRVNWLLKTSAGLTAGFTAVLGLLVGAVVTSQALYAATLAALREFAVLRALGIPRSRIAGLVMAQAFWVGLVGVCLGIPASFGLGMLGDVLGTRVLLPVWLLTGVAVLALAVALIAGLAALRSLRHTEPAVLLR